MNIYYIIASILIVLIGLAHSILGEIIIFKPLRSDGIVPKVAQAKVRGRFLRIIWACWHIMTVFAFGFAYILYELAFTTITPIHPDVIPYSILISMLMSSALIFYATNARHQGWLGLFLVAIAIYFG